MTDTLIAIAGPGIATTEGDPSLAQDFELALKSMRRMKVTSFTAFDIDEARQHIGYTDQQVQALTLLKESGIADPLSTVPLVTAGVCTSCGEHLWLGSKSAPAKCQMTLGCEGAMVKARSTGNGARR